MLSCYDIVLVAFPFTDGPSAKPRPALVLAFSERHQDVLLAFISSRVVGPPNGDELDIQADHPGFGGGSADCRAISSRAAETCCARPSAARVEHSRGSHTS